MIADTSFLIHLMRERDEGRRGPALSFLAAQRGQVVRTCIVSIAEIAVGFRRSGDAWQYFKAFRIYPLHGGIAEAAADVDRELILAGGRLGENDNWIAGFARYYQEPIISLDTAFDRVRRVRRLVY